MINETITNSEATPEKATKCNKAFLGISSSNEMSVAFTMLSFSEVLYELGGFFLCPPSVAHFLRRLLAQCYL